MTLIWTVEGVGYMMDVYQLAEGGYYGVIMDKDTSIVSEAISGDTVRELRDFFTYNYYR